MTTFDSLTPRRAEIAKMLTHGLKDKEIARHLGLSFYTVADHVAIVRATYHALSRSHLAVLVDRDLRQ
jgi:DNA-binding NarL/FixJ family response regulator